MLEKLFTEIEEMPYLKLKKLVEIADFYNLDKHFTFEREFTVQDKQQIITHLQTCLYRSFNEKRWEEKRLEDKQGEEIDFF